jgi:cholesterol oxidase
MSFDFDVVVIGSGFGGAVMSCRLTEKGKSVCLLERGKQYGMHQFPRRVHEIKDSFFWNPKEKSYGVMEFRNYPESDLMSVTASGLGGGSLIYANVLMRMPAEYFKGWPGGIDRNKLDPYYDKVLDMMEASPYPQDDDYYQHTPKTQALQSVASKVTGGSSSTEKPQFILPHLAIRFKGNFPGEQGVNKHGATQSKCNMCGECDIGCNIHAKNTLDLNYIQRAKTDGADIRLGAQVESIAPCDGNGYHVTYKNIDGDNSTVTLSAQKVFICCGSLGSNRLLLKMRREGKLNHISSLLGKKWCGNGDLEGTVVNTKKDLLPSKGPVITGAIQYRFRPYSDGFPHGAFIQDAGMPIGLSWFLAGKAPSPFSSWTTFKFSLYLLGNRILRALRIKGAGQTPLNMSEYFSGLIDSDYLVRRAFLLLGMGRDRSNGEIQLREDGEPVIKWEIEPNQLHYDRVRDAMREIAEQMDGTFVDNPLTHLEKIIAVHPLGGAIMGNSVEDGVVDTKGEVFGHPNLYVVDASIIPTSIGPNPSLTIAALAEYIADQL